MSTEPRGLGLEQLKLKQSKAWDEHRQAREATKVEETKKVVDNDEANQQHLDELPSC